MFIRAQYGNGARVGFDREWRSKAELAGGGELLDQGVHVIDLASQFLPAMKVLSGYAKTHFWNMEVDDNTWAMLADENDATFSFHVSSTEWKNEFRFEVYTRSRKYQWLGLGRSYGPEKLNIYTMKPEMGPPLIQEKVYSEIDLSWKKESENFFAAIEGRQQPIGGVDDALKCLKLVEAIYLSSLKAQGPSRHPKWFEVKR